MLQSVAVRTQHHHIRDPRLPLPFRDGVEVMNIELAWNLGREAALAHAGQSVMAQRRQAQRRVSLGLGWNNFPPRTLDELALGSLPCETLRDEASKFFTPAIEYIDRAHRIRRSQSAPDHLPSMLCPAKRTKMRCRAPAMNGKAVCRFHGSLSTGPKTAAGRARCAAAKTAHGQQTRPARKELAEQMGEIARLKALARMMGMV